MTKNQEEIRSEEERVESFMQALQRMHDDPAEAARIDTIIEDAEGIDDGSSSHGQPLVVHIHNEGGHNVVDLSPSRPSTVREPEPSTPTLKKVKQKRSRYLDLQPLTAVPALAAMTAVVITSIGYASEQVSSVLASILMLVATAQILLSERIKMRGQRLQAKEVAASRAEEKETRELNNH